MIRSARPEDAPAVEACACRAYEPYLPRLEGQRLPPLEADYANEIVDYPAWVFDDGAILGVLLMDFADDASISNVFVDPTSQGRGIGRQLLDFAEVEAARRGYVELHLATHVLFSENVALYEHLGWRRTGGDEVRIFMAKPLGGTTDA